MFLDDETFADQLIDRLAVIEDRLMETAVANSPFMTQAAQHIISAGGKRFRPLLVCVASCFGDRVVPEDIVRAALVVELTHVASLYHDDVMDDAELRRGAQSANSRWGNTVAIMVGDYLFARASSTVAELGVEYVALQAKTFARLVSGQIAETKGPADGDDPVQHYLQVIADKTGSLIATSAVFGAMVAGADQEIIDALEAYGEELGVVFQLSDDLIDITSDATGKTPGTDLREGVSTLPTLLLVASNDPSDEHLKNLIASDLSDDARLAEAVALLRAHPVLQAAKAEVERRADNAKRLLAPLPEGPAKQALVQVCTDLVNRAS